MSPVQRAKGIRKMIRQYIFGRPVQKYVLAGDRACRRMARKVRSPQQCTPSDQAILAWARYDLHREIESGFWEIKAA